MGFRGDFKKLAAKTEGLSLLASGRFIREAAQGMGTESFALAKHSIAARSAPTGRPWPLRADGQPALGNVGRGIHLVVGGAGFRIVIPDRMRGETNYLAANQAGARHRPKQGGKPISRDALRRMARTEAVARRVARERYGGRPTRDQVRGLVDALVDDLERDRWRLPARRILPKRSLPRKWRDAMTRIVERAFEDAVGSRAR